MQFTLTGEQQLIQTSILDWLAGNYDFRRRAAGVHQDGGAPAVWKAFARLGWLGLPLGEAAGGIEAGPLEAGLLMQAFGRHQVVEPFHACVLQAARLLALAGTPAQRQRWLPRVVDGQERLALAHAEPGETLPWARRRCTAVRHAGGWRLSGSKQLVVGAPGAAAWIVSAREVEVQAGEAVSGGDLLFLLDPCRPGLTVEAYDTTDGMRAVDFRMENVELDVDARVGDPAVDVAALLHQVLAEGIVCRCWEATGAMQAALEQTVQYTQQRRQFGQPLAEFQVVQHRLAEMAVLCTEAQAACELASMKVGRSAAGLPTVAAMAKNKVARAARFVAQEAVQLHGAMGVCEELPVASTFRMLLMFSQAGGSAAAHAAQLGTSLLAGRTYARSATLGMPQ